MPLLSLWDGEGLYDLICPVAFTHCTYSLWIPQVHRASCQISVWKPFLKLLGCYMFLENRFWKYVALISCPACIVIISKLTWHHRWQFVFSLFFPYVFVVVVIFKFCSQVWRLPSNLKYKMHLNREIVDYSDVVGASLVAAAPTTSSFSPPGFNRLRRDNCKTSWDTFKFCNLVWLILEILQCINGLAQDCDNSSASVLS